MEKVWKLPPMLAVSPRDQASFADHCAATGTDSVAP
jgi:hypothetical protein